MNALRSYCGELADRFGDGWNRFWFLPSAAHASALLRMAVGAIALAWLITLSFDLQALFGPGGWLPVDKVASWRGGRGWSLLDFVQDPALLWSVHALAIAVVGLFTVGLFTRVTSIVSAIIVLSYLWRAPMLNAEVEDLLAMLLVYLCIGRCGAVWSVDGWRRRRRPSTASALPRLSSLTTVSMRLVQVHLAAIYVMMALAKCRGAVWWTGEATWWMASSSQRSWLSLDWLAQHPDLIAAVTFGIVALQLAFPVLVWNRTARPLMLALATVMWIGIWLLAGQTGFCLLMLAAHLAFVSPQWLGRCCEERIGSLPQRGAVDKPSPVAAAAR
jgi:hypothetical protein